MHSGRYLLINYLFHPWSHQTVVLTPLLCLVPMSGTTYLIILEIRCSLQFTSLVGRACTTMLRPYIIGPMHNSSVSVMVFVWVVSRRGLVLILTNAPSLYRGHFSVPRRVVENARQAGPRRQAQSGQSSYTGRPTAQPHPSNPATSVSTWQRVQQLNASEFNCCHLSQIIEDTGEPSVPVSGNLIL